MRYQDGGRKCEPSGLGGEGTEEGFRSHLHGRDPGVGVGVLLLTVWTHVGLNHVLYNKRLLQDGPVEDLRLDRDLHLQPPGVRLRPDEPRIHQLHLHQHPGKSVTLKTL
jgi:hypothetical protein